jgi:hypothetical protein
MTQLRAISSPREIVNAYLTLFGQAGDDRISLLRRLSPAEIRAAYRKQALRHHPDRARVLGLAPDAMSERFMTVRAAYELLYTYIIRRKPGTAPGHAAGETDPGSRHASASPQKDRGQPLGQYLFSRGIISFSTLVEAITWQRRGRPSYGDIARQMGVLNERDMEKIQAARRPREKTGECAVRIGCVNSLTSRMIIARQEELQKPLGEFFVSRGILTRTLLSEILESRQCRETAEDGDNPKKS